MTNILSDKSASYMRSFAIQALMEAHESNIKPEEFFSVAQEVAQLLAAVEHTVALTGMMNMVKAQMEPAQMLEDLTVAASVSSTDACRFFQRMSISMKLIAITMDERTLN
jgi:pantothenate synthetase